jgi:phosphomannomutase
LKTRYKDNALNEEDGLRVDFTDSWANFRKSNTEPIIRIITEARSAGEAEELQTRFLSEIKGLLTNN